MSTLFDQPTEAPTMSTELVEHEHPPDAPAALISQAISAGIPLGELREYAKEWEASQAADAFGHALAEFQAHCPQIKKNRQIDLGGGKGPQYASYDDIDEIVRPFMAEYGLSKTFSANITDTGQMRVVCKIRHGRHVEQNEVTLPVPTQMRVNDTQKMGAALQYGKRYALCAALDIVVTDEDKDARNMFVGINELQLATIEDWISLMGDKFKLRPFLKWLEIEMLSELPADKYEMVVTELQSKAKSLGFTK